jgi:MFS family permease
MLSVWFALEERIVDSLGWPSWALRTAGVLCCVLLIVSLPQMLGFARAGGEKVELSGERKREFRLFQSQYLTVFLIIMLADWLQGTNMYTLYSSYGVNIGNLFLSGFLSSAVFGTFLGIFVDRWGRRFGCLVFCVLEIIINLLEHIPDMRLLLLGRILGGITTSLLFSAFESWMVSEHRKKGFPEELLSSTFAIASWGNGVMAIGAGFLAQVASDSRGDIGPFQVAILLTIVCLGLILFWEENMGDHSDSSEQISDKAGGSAVAEAKVKEQPSFRESCRLSVSIIYQNPAILFLGLSQAFFEGAVFSFVFMWVPSLLSAGDGILPTGLIFSCFMISMTIGGIVFSLALSHLPVDAEFLCVIVYTISAASMLVPVFTFQFWPVFIAFIVLEGMLGMFNSCGAQLRSRYYPDNLQSSIMSVFRLPLNLLVVLGTKLSERASDDVPALQRVFGVVALMHLTALVLQLLLYFKCFSKPVGSSGVASTVKEKTS